MLFKKWFTPFLEADGVGGGEVAPVAPESTPEPTPEPTQTTPEAPAEPVASASTEEGTFGLYIDKETGRPTLKRETPNEEPAPEPPQQEENYGDKGASDVANEGSNEVFDEKPKYNLDEFSIALANGNIDASRVPQEYQAQYADYRIRQAMNEYAKRQQEEAQKKEQIQKQLSPEEQVQANKDFYRQLDHDARNAALADLGMTQEELDNSLLDVDGEQIRADYETAYQWHKQNLANKLYARENARIAHQQQQQSIYQDIQNYAAEERAKDPKNFDAIDKYSISRLENMPFSKALPVQQAFMALKDGSITVEQTQLLKKHFEETKKEYIAKKNGLSTKPKAVRKPPVVESAGNGQKTVSEYIPDYSGLRNARSNKERRAWLKSFVQNTFE